MVTQAAPPAAPAPKKNNRFQLPPTPKPFTKDNQPSSEAKKAGWQKRKILKQLLELSTGATFNNSTTDYRQLAANYFGIEPEEVTVETVMTFRQIEKAIMKADTPAFIAVMDRAHGKPKGEQEPAKSLNITINGQKIEQKP